MPRLPTTVLFLAALGFLGFGAWLLVDPAGGLAGVDIGATSPAGLVERRAFYGGLEVGLGLFLLACATRPAWHAPGLWLVLLGNLFIGLARVYGIASSGVFTGFFAAALVWEFGFPLLAWLALRRMRAN
jgi:hypothetical protein